MNDVEKTETPEDVDLSFAANEAVKILPDELKAFLDGLGNFEEEFERKKERLFNNSRIPVRRRGCRII